MTWQLLLVALVNALVWPTFLTFVLIFFKNEVKRIFDGITRLKIFGVEADVAVDRGLNETEGKIVESISRGDVSLAAAVTGDVSLAAAVTVVASGEVTSQAPSISSGDEIKERVIEFYPNRLEVAKSKEWHANHKRRLRFTGPLKPIRDSEILNDEGNDAELKNLPSYTFKNGFSNTDLDSEAKDNRKEIFQAWYSLRKKLRQKAAQQNGAFVSDEEWSAIDSAFWLYDHGSIDESLFEAIVDLDGVRQAMSKIGFGTLKHGQIKRFVNATQSIKSRIDIEPVTGKSP